MKTQGNILDGENGCIVTNKEGDMDIDWGGQGPASMPTGNSYGRLEYGQMFAMITGGGNTTSTMGVSQEWVQRYKNCHDISDLKIDKGGEVNTQ